MRVTSKIAPCLWFDNQAEEAANFYVSVFKNSRIVQVTRYTEAGREIHKRPAGSVMTVAFELEGQAFTALNGGPIFKFNEAISLQVNCDTQKELDYYWDSLSKGGDPKAQQCGWLKDTVRPLMAGRAPSAPGPAQRSHIRKSGAGHGRHAPHEEDRHRRA